MTKPLEMTALGANGKPNGYTVHVSLPDNIERPFKLSPETLKEFMNRAVEETNRSGVFRAFCTTHDEANYEVLAALAEALDGDVLVVNGIVMFYWRKFSGSKAKRQKFRLIAKRFLCEKVIRYPMQFRLKRTRFVDMGPVEPGHI